MGTVNPFFRIERSQEKKERMSQAQATVSPTVSYNAVEEIADAEAEAIIASVHI